MEHALGMLVVDVKGIVRNVSPILTNVTYVDTPNVAVASPILTKGVAIVYTLMQSLVLSVAGVLFLFVVATFSISLSNTVVHGGLRDT